jgi:predicted transcriptional regulator of viral defense system
MSLLETDTQLRKLGVSLVSTTDVAAHLNISRTHASTILRRLAAAGKVQPLIRNRWLLEPSKDPFAIPEFLAAPWPAYISVQSALYHHGMISQIPAVVYALSLGRTMRYETTQGVFSLHHISTDFFFGFQSASSLGYHIAEPEKALLDLFYLTAARSNLFRVLPEVELPRAFSSKKAFAMIEKIKSRSRRTLVRRRFEELLKKK